MGDTRHPMEVQEGGPQIEGHAQRHSDVKAWGMGDPALEGKK